jgi:hypothetical protein
MKKSLLFLAFVLFISASLFAQGKKVHLHLNHLLGSTKMEYMKAVKSPSTYFFKVELLRYYISEIKITHDGGKVDDVKDTWILVNPEKGNEYELGTFDVKNIEGIQFSLGVDKAHNHLDPTTYPATHPLAMQNPTMHWGWTSGYRFITFEGYAGATEATATTNFQLHTLDDTNYKTVKITTGATNENGDLLITLNADYTQMLKGINANTGVISHGATGAAATQMKNLAASVFTAKSSVGVEDLMTLDVAVYPNPATSQIMIKASISGVDNQEVTITNIAGQVVLKAQKSGETLQLALSLSAGNYMISIAENGKTIGREKLVIVE